ncbi:MAG: glycosyltransferase [bacterium]|nr:glycosyltransferase [bacterium]
MAQQSVYLIIAGGTGGHIVPGLGLALEFAAAGDPVHFLSLEKNRGYADFKDAPFPVHFYGAPPIRKSPSALLAFPFRFARALWRAAALMRKHRVSCVIGMGGYSIFPGVLAARLSGVPYYLCEQNAIPGRATRLFAGGARRIFLNFPVAAAHQSGAFAGERALLAGNPLRPQLKAIAEENRAASKKKGAGSARPGKKKSAAKSGARGRGKAKDGLTVLVLGGSQGAAQINAMVAAAIPQLASGSGNQAGANSNPNSKTKTKTKSNAKKKSRAHTQTGPVARWMIQCGEKNLDQMRALLPENRFGNVTLFGYHPGIADFYREADLLIARAGAGVVSEALVFGLPMILIPYPFAADNHQLGNAEYLRDGGVAHCISTRETDPAELIEVLRRWSADSTELMNRSSRALDLARPGAAAEIRASIVADLSKA